MSNRGTNIGDPASRSERNRAGSSEEASFARDLTVLPLIEPSTNVNRGDSRADALLDEDYSEIPPRTETNRVDKRRGAAIVTEANDGGTPAVISLARASAALTQPKSNMGMNRGDPESRSEMSKPQSLEEASLARDLANLPLPEPSTDVKIGDARADALLDGDSD